MTRLIDADALFEQMKHRKEFVGRPSDPVCLVEDAPTIDAAPVVRCKDCKECYFASNRIPTEQSYVCGKHGIDVSPEWFCADGERD